MIKTEAQLRYAFEAIVKLYRSRAVYLKSIPESEARGAAIEGLGHESVNKWTGWLPNSAVSSGMES